MAITPSEVFEFVVAALQRRRVAVRARCASPGARTTAVAAARPAEAAPPTVVSGAAAPGALGRLGPAVHHGAVDEGVRLRRDTAKARRHYLFLALVGAGGWGAARYSEADPNSVFTSTGPIKYASLVMFLGGACALVTLVWPFVIDVDDDGMTLRARGVTTRLPWSSVEMLTVAKIGTDWSDPMLQIRVAPGVRIKGRVGSDHEGRRVYNLLPLESFTLWPEQVVAILTDRSGGKVDAQDYLNYRAGKRAVARWLTEEQRGREPSGEEPGETR